MPLAMTQEVFITCAITGAIHTPSMTPHLPITPDEIDLLAERAHRAIDETHKRLKEEVLMVAPN